MILVAVLAVLAALVVQGCGAMKISEAGGVV